jgi:hypothetical protein
MFVLLAGMSPLAAGDRVILYVAVDGNDAWSGTLPSPTSDKRDGPFATLIRARDAIRPQRASPGLKMGASVMLRGGTYYLSQQLTLGPEDGGRPGAGIIYAAYAGEKVQLKGSYPIGGWQLYHGNVYQAKVPREITNHGRFWQLFYHGQQQILARYPNFDPEHPRTGGFLYAPRTVEKGSRTLLAYDATRLYPSRWKRPNEIRINVWPWQNWSRNICGLVKIDVTNQVFTLTPATYMLSEGDRFFLENAKEDLDGPGEWYYDERNHNLYFWPPNNSAPDSPVTVPVLDTLVSIQGDDIPTAAVSNVSFLHLELSETRSNLITLGNARNCSVAGCTLSGCGDIAVKITEGSHGNEIIGCDIAHVGGSAIVLDGAIDRTDALNTHLSSNNISNNHVHDVGAGGNAGGAIMINAISGGNGTHDNVISHNLVYDTPRQGITINGVRNRVEYNHVHHTNQEQADGGAIGVVARDLYERGCVIRFNFVHDTGGYDMIKPGVWASAHNCCGIYLDDYTSGVHVHGNLVLRTSRGAIIIRGGQDNLIENNIIVEGGVSQLEYVPLDSQANRPDPEHPDKSVWLMKGNRCVRNIFSYQDPQSAWVTGGKWQQILTESDRNLIWHAGLPITVNLAGVTSGEYWSAWQKMGFDAHSTIADPQFLNPSADDYRVQPGSPALPLGFIPPPLDKIGLFASIYRASWPVKNDQPREKPLLSPE